MRIITRQDQQAQLSKATPPPGAQPDDRFFDGQPLPRPIQAHNWITEGSVHRERILSSSVDNTRYLLGPQVSIVRDDNRRVTWAATVEDLDGGHGQKQLWLSRFDGSRPETAASPRLERKLVATGDIWRFHIALNKFDGEVSVAWITRSGQGSTLWLNGQRVETKSPDPDFPFFAFSQPPIGHVVREAPPFAVLGYKCRKSGQCFLRRVQGGKPGPEILLKTDKTIGGVSFGISEDKVLARVDQVHRGKVVPALIHSSDAGGTFGKAEALSLSGYDGGFQVVPGYTEPVVDIGGNFHVPVHAASKQESVALNYVVREDALVEAIRVAGTHPLLDEVGANRAASQVTLEVFPATLGNPNGYGTGTTDGHGLIMVLSTEGRLFSSNSSAGGLFFPDSALLNHEMPLVSVFATTECYTTGLKPNFVSMDYLYFEANAVGQPISSDLQMETWDMPLPVPAARAESSGSRVEVTVVADADFEPGEVSFRFEDPCVRIKNVEVTSLRTAVIDTDTEDLKGKTLIYDVDSLFHRHYGEVVVA